MQAYCKRHQGLSKQVMLKVSADLYTWVCEPCLTLGYTEARRQAEAVRKRSISDTEVFDTWVKTAGLDF